MAISSELEQLLAGWIPRQSWFPKLAADFGTDPDITPMSVARAFTFTAEELGGFSGLVTVISVGDGPTLRRLNIPLSLRGAEDLHLRHALIGRVDDLALGRVFVYDGAADPVFVNLLADAIVRRRVFDGGQLSTESLRHSRDRGHQTTTEPSRGAVPAPTSAATSVAADAADSGAGALPPKPLSAPLLTEVQEALDIEIRPIEVADSGANKSTVIIHDQYEPVELSFFRVLENGMPSSLTIPVLLTEAGSRSVPEVIGWSSGRWYDMFEVTEMEAPMALLSHTDVEAEPAWREAVDIVCAVDSGSIGGYNAQAAEMGRRIGELHADMAAEFGIVEGRGEPTRQFVDKWVERVDWALGRAPLALDSLAPELKRHKAKLRSLDTIGQLQKIHGELTLDHVVSSPSEGYTVVKFTDSSNSDPKPVALDLVALLRSVDYAAGFARLQRTEALNSEDGGLVVNGFGDDPAALRAIYDSPECLWASQVQNSLLSGYSRARGESIGLSDPVLRAALIDRLLVEVVTELRNRPNWLSVPLATLTLILRGKPVRGSGEPTEVELSAPATQTAESDAESTESESAADAPGESPAVAESPRNHENVEDVRGQGDFDNAAAHSVMVDAVTTETVEPQQGEIAEMVSDSPGFTEPSVEAPTIVSGEPTAVRTDTEEAANGGRASGPAGDPAVDAETPSGPDATTSARGTTVSRPVAIARGIAPASAAAAGTAAEDRFADEGENRAVGVGVDHAYVDAVTTEAVAPVDDGVPATDLGVHDQVDPNPEAPDPGARSDGADTEALPAAPPMSHEPVEPEPEPLPDAPVIGAASEDSDEEFEDEADEEESEFVPSRVPATFAARGATSSDADSTGRSPDEQHRHEAAETREAPAGESAGKSRKGRHKH